MDTSIYVATAAQKSIQRQLEIIANNIANSNTVGFRAESIEFHSLVSKPGADNVHYPVVSDIHPSLANGALNKTKNPLDIALSGEGWFAIGTPAGVAYTRDGRMQVSPFGELQNLEGHPILDSAQAPILIPTNSGSPKIHKDGRIEVNGVLAGNIGVFALDAHEIDGRFSSSAFFSSNVAIPISVGSKTAVLQNFVEESNVNPMQELANLITVSRSFDSAASVVEGADKSISRAVNTLSE